MYFTIPASLLVGMMLTLLPLQAQTMNWEESPQFELDLNGKLDVMAKVYQPTSSKPYLIVLSKMFSSPLLIELSSKSVKVLSSSNIKPGAEYYLTTAGLPSGKGVATYKMKDGVSTFSYDKKTVAIRIKESLVGEVSEAIILAHSPIYGMLRDKYTPKKSAISFLKNYRTKTDIVVMFATWCPTCKVVIPRFLRIVKDAHNHNFSVRFIGIAMGGNEPAAELAKYGHDYPCLILYQNGKEKGRVIGDPPAALEDAIVTYLK